MPETADQWRESDYDEIDEHGQRVRLIWRMLPDRDDGACVELVADRERWVFNEYLSVSPEIQHYNGGKPFARYSTYLSRKLYPNEQDAAVLGWRWLLAGYGKDAREGRPVDTTPLLEVNSE